MKWHEANKVIRKKKLHNDNTAHDRNNNISADIALNFNNRLQTLNMDDYIILLEKHWYILRRLKYAAQWLLYTKSSMPIIRCFVSFSRSFSGGAASYMRVHSVQTLTS